MKSVVAEKIADEIVESSGNREIVARRNICWDMANRRAVELGVHALYLQSREWRGYQKAFDSWQRAIWRWADAGTSDQKAHWRQFLLDHRHLLPSEPGMASPVSDLDVERALQTYLLRRAVFLGRAASRQKDQPAWWKRQSTFLCLAAQLDDDEVFERMGQLTRKSDRPGGSRELRDWLRTFWFPGCLWAFTNNGISALINRYSDAGGNYSEGSVKNAIATLKLWRPVKPLYWGLDKDNELVPLR